MRIDKIASEVEYRIQTIPKFVNFEILIIFQIKKKIKFQKGIIWKMIKYSKWFILNILKFEKLLTILSFQLMSKKWNNKFGNKTME